MTGHVNTLAASLYNHLMYSFYVMNSNFFCVIVFFCLFFAVKAQNCEELLQSSENNECDALTSREDCSNITECSYDFRNNTNSTYEVDMGRGIVISRFRLPPSQCCYSMYKVSLWINEQVQDESMCTDDLSTKDYVRHSNKEYKIKTCEKGNCSGKPCGKQGEMVFKYVYTGCYKILIEAYNGSKVLESISPFGPLFIETNYSKLAVVGLNMTFNYRQAENLSEVFIDLNSTFERMIISFIGEITKTEDDPCDSDGEELACCLLEANGNSSLCLPTSKAKEPTCTSSKSDAINHITCNFYDFPPGNYCVRVVDERCKRGILEKQENRECQWAQLKALKNTSPDKPQVNVLSSHTVIIVVLLLVVTILGLPILVFILRRKGQMLERPLVQSPEEMMTPMINGVKVLLLYPRDCQEFMALMESFRKVLEAQNIEVFDCHSSGEVLMGPLHWLKKVMGLPSIRTIIVNTPCAYLQEQAILNGCNITNYSLYKDPIFLDSIFMYGLKVIMEDISPDSYLRNYVIGFNGFSDDEKSISLTTFRRYNVPEHLPRLFVDMNLDFTEENHQLDDSSEYIQLLSNILNLVNYNSMNPHYLDNILNLA